MADEQDFTVEGYVPFDLYAVNDITFVALPKAQYQTLVAERDRLQRELDQAWHEWKVEVESLLFVIRTHRDAFAAEWGEDFIFEAAPYDKNLWSVLPDEENNE